MPYKTTGVLELSEMTIRKKIVEQQYLKERDVVSILAKHNIEMTKLKMDYEKKYDALTAKTSAKKQKMIETRTKNTLYFEELLSGIQQKLTKKKNSEVKIDVSPVLPCETTCETTPDTSEGV